MADYFSRLANAVSVRGYATVDLRAIQRTPFVRLDAALNAAQSTYSTVSQPNWQAAINHLVNLKVLHADTVSVRTRDQRILLIVNRHSVGNLDIEEVLNYHAAMDQWLKTLSEYLPKLELSEGEAKNVERAKDWVGKWSNSDSIAWAAAKLLAVLYLSKGKGVCVTVHPVGNAPADFVRRWQAADLTSEHFFAQRIHSSNYLWKVGTNDLWYGGTSGLENPDDTNFEPWVSDLATLLKAASD